MRAPPARAPAGRQAAAGPARSRGRSVGPTSTLVRPLAPTPTSLRPTAPAPAAARPARAPGGFDLGQVAIAAPQPRPRPPAAPDPATVVEEARRGPPVALPHRAAAERVFAVPLAGLEVHTGGAAARACQTLGASAFAVRNVVAFADDAPGLALVLHEVAHVLQQDGLGDRAPGRFTPGSLRTSQPDEAAEREAVAAAKAAAPPRTTTTPAPSTATTRPRRLRRALIAVYRNSPQDSVDDKKDPATEGEPEAVKVIVPAEIKAVAAKRIWIFANKSPFAAANQDTPRFATRTDGAPPTFTALKTTSPTPWHRSDYTTFMTSADGKKLLAAAELTEVTSERAGADISVELKTHMTALTIARVRRSPKSPSSKVQTGPYVCLAEEPTLDIYDLDNPEARLLKFKKDANYALTTPAKPRYGRKKDITDPDIGDAAWIIRYPEGSKNSFDSTDYSEVVTGAVAKPVAPAAEGEEAPDETPRGAAGDLAFLLANGLAEAFGLARVGSSEDARTFALVAGQKPYFPLIQLTDKKEARPPGAVISDYKDILKGIPKVANATLETRAEKNKSKGADQPFDKDDARAARKDLMKKVVDAYTDADEAAFFTDVIGGKPSAEVKPPAKGESKPEPKGDLFGSTYARIKGNIFEDWIFKWRFKGVNVVIDRAQPYFVWKEQAPESSRMKRRFGDGRLVGAKGDNVILEAKAYTEKTVPTLGNEKDATKDDDLVLQMKDYATIINKKIEAWSVEPKVIEVEELLESELEEKPSQKGTPKSPQKPMLFQYVLYEFGDVTVADKWAKALRSTLLKLYATDPKITGDKDGEAVRLQIGFNPTLPITVPKGGGVDTKITTFPGFKQPGVTMKEANIKLALPGKPALVAGSSLTMDVDMKGLKQEGAVKPIEPVAAEPAAAKPGAPAVPLHGRAANKFSGLKSKLDDFLKRVHTDARLIEGGVEAEITITDGASGIPGLNLVGTILKASYTLGKGLAVVGKVGLERPDKKIAGQVEVKYEQDEWTYSGQCTVKDLIPGLDQFTVTAYVRGEEKRVGVDLIKISKKLGAVTLTGSVTKLQYDVSNEKFSAENIHLDAAIPAFGTVGADGKIANDAIEKLTFSYESKELAYGPKDKPIIAGKLRGSATFEKGTFAEAKIGGDANLKLPALEKIAKGLGDLGFVIDATISAEGEVSGTIKTASDKPIELGKYFRIPSLAITLNKDGTISSEFSLEVVNLKYVKQARVDIALSAAGFKVLRASATAKFGDETKDRVAAELGLSYDVATEAFIVSGTVWVRIKEGIVGKGKFVWNSATGKMDADLSVSKITLLDFTGNKPFLKVKKKIQLVSFYNIIGIYLDLRFELGFQYAFNLAITPRVRLTGLKFDDNNDLQFDLAVATVTLEGELSATLVGTPGVGLGLFAGHVDLLSGGGGIKVPIAATAKAKPKGTVEIKYKPDGTLDGGGRVGITLTFGMTGKIKPYAELSVLKDTWNPNWEGESLKDFVILEERELFTYFINFGAPLEKEKSPAPAEDNDKTKPPPAKASDEKERFGTTRTGDKCEDPPTGLRKQEAPEKQTADETKDGGGFSLTGMVDNLLNQEKFAPIKKVLDAAGKAWEKITGFFKDLLAFFKNWFDTAVEGIENLIEAIRTMAEEGILPYFKKLLQRKLGPLYDIIAPLFDALDKLGTSFEVQLKKLLGDPIPTTPTAFFTWTMSTLAEVLSIAIGGVTDLAMAVVKVFKNAAVAGGNFVNHLVQKGKIGVRRWVYYIPGIPAPWPVEGYIKDPIYFYAPTEYWIDVWDFKKTERVEGDLIGLADILDPMRVVDKAIAFGLWTALRNIPQVQTTNDEPDDSRISESRQNYWV